MLNKCASPEFSPQQSPALHLRLECCTDLLRRTEKLGWTHWSWTGTLGCVIAVPVILTVKVVRQRPRQGALETITPKVKTKQRFYLSQCNFRHCVWNLPLCVVLKWVTLLEWILSSVRAQCSICLFVTTSSLEQSVSWAEVIWAPQCDSLVGTWDRNSLTTNRRWGQGHSGGQSLTSASVSA